MHSLFSFSLYGFHQFICWCMFVYNLIKISPLQEPVQDEDNILKFCEESGLSIALDETIDSMQENPMEKLVKFTHPAISAVVSK